MNTVKHPPGRQPGSWCLPVPRLFGDLMAGNGRLPVGEAVWGDTWVELPPARMHMQWDNVLTGQTVDMQPLGEAHGLPLARVFERFPYALLRAHDRPHSLTEEKQA